MMETIRRMARKYKVIELTNDNDEDDDNDGGDGDGFP